MAKDGCARRVGRIAKWQMLGVPYDLAGGEPRPARWVLMYANFLIGLREGLEAALVVGILVAYLVHPAAAQRLPRIWLGVGVRLPVSLGVGAAADVRAARPQLRGPGGDRRHAVDRRRRLRHLDDLLDGRAPRARCRGELRGPGRRAPPTATAVAARGRRHPRGRPRGPGDRAVPVGRHGGGDRRRRRPPVAGGRRRSGIARRRALGIVVYRGAVRINLGTFFPWTGGFLVVVAAGVLAYGVHDLQEAGILPGLDTHRLRRHGAVPPASWYGTLLKGIFNFSPAHHRGSRRSPGSRYLVPVMTLFVRRVRTAADPDGARRARPAAARPPSAGAGRLLTRPPPTCPDVPPPAGLTTRRRRPLVVLAATACTDDRRPTTRRGAIAVRRHRRRLQGLRPPRRRRAPSSSR